MKHEIKQAYTEMINEMVNNKYYANMAGQVINDAVKGISKIRYEVEQKTIGTKSNTTTEEEKDKLDDIKKVLNDIIIDLGKITAKAGKIKG